MLSRDWEQCSFCTEHGMLERPNVHDNFVYALASHLEKRLLILHTQYRDGGGPHEFTDVRFVEVVAFHFDDLVSPSILLDIGRVSAEWVVQKWGRLIESRKNYGWLRLEFTDLDDLSMKLHTQGVSGYHVIGSCGLDGFVLAKSADYRFRDQPAEFT